MHIYAKVLLLLRSFWHKVCQMIVNYTKGGMAELVERIGLENRRTLTRTGGSNPSSSAEAQIL